MTSPRTTGLILSGFRSLGIIRYDRGQGYFCSECNRYMNEGESIRLHIGRKKEHHEMYLILKNLISAWGLVGDQVESDKRYVCECGKSYARYQGLYAHRKASGHLKAKSPVELISLQI